LKGHSKSSYINIPQQPRACLVPFPR